MMEKILLIASIIGALTLIVYSCAMVLKKGAALGSLSETAYISILVWVVYGGGKSSL